MTAGGLRCLCAAGRDAPELANDSSRRALGHAAELLGVPYAQLLAVLTTRTRQTPEGARGVRLAGVWR